MDFWHSSINSLKINMSRLEMYICLPINYLTTDRRIMNRSFHHLNVTFMMLIILLFCGGQVDSRISCPEISFSSARWCKIIILSGIFAHFKQLPLRHRDLSPNSFSRLCQNTTFWQLSVELMILKLCIWEKEMWNVCCYSVAVEISRIKLLDNIYEITGRRRVMKLRQLENVTPSNYCNWDGGCGWLVKMKWVTVSVICENRENWFESLTWTNKVTDVCASNASHCVLKLEFVTNQWVD